MSSLGLRSPFIKVGGFVYFGRMLDKIRLHAKSSLPEDYQANLGKGFDERCVQFLRIDYNDGRSGKRGQDGRRNFAVVPDFRTTPFRRRNLCVE